MFVRSFRQQHLKADQRVLLLPQRSVMDNDPDFDALNSVGTVAHIKQIVRAPGEAARLLVEGLYRVLVVTALKTEPYLCAKTVRLQDETATLTPKLEAMMRTAYRLFEEYMELSQRPLHEEMLQMLSSKDAG